VPLITRRNMLAAGGTLAAGLIARKPRAAIVLGDISSHLVLTDPPAAPPDVVFVSADGKEHRLTEFVGHGMVINLWATWCVPCVAEMPALAALSKTLAPDDIAVLPLSSDRGGTSVVEAFYEEHGIMATGAARSQGGGRARMAGAWPADQPDN